jgi:5'-nucleotidase (lipoprotein e(P4) family)
MYREAGREANRNLPYRPFRVRSSDPFSKVQRMDERASGRIGRRRALGLLGAAAAGGVILAPRSLRGRPEEAVGSPDAYACNPLLWAVAWKETSAEYRALCHQAFNLARMLLDRALETRNPSGPPLAIITDIDDTILHAGDYWGELITRGYDFFDDEISDEWIPRNLVTASPGALDFLRYAADRGVEIFYVTNRDQGEETFRFALRQLQLLEFPFADEAHLTVLRDTSNKEPARQKVAEQFEVVLLLGDNLNDFKRDYYVADVDQRIALMEADRDLFGTRFIVLPNPTDGHWVRAIFGDSEPPPTEENRKRLQDAATRTHRGRS